MVGDTGPRQPETSMIERLNAQSTLPADGVAGTLVGRAWVAGDPPGPSVVVFRPGGVFELGALAPTMSTLLDADDPVAVAHGGDARRLGDLDEILANSGPDWRDDGTPSLLAPCDLQAVKACGVTFAASMVERVIEEQAGGDATRADDIRRTIADLIGGDLQDMVPGSPEAMRLKADLVERGAWSPYLEVGIGPDAEVFTKAQPMAAVGTGAEIGLHPDSSWNNPEPEVVLAVNSRAKAVGAALGNDVNLRDIEGRSALLLGKAKDNNASCAIGPFIRLFDDTFTIDDVRGAEISLTVDGPEGYRLTGHSSMGQISRDPLDLVAATGGPTHQYPDGFMLFLGTLFAPTEDRDAPGQGFTHKIGDVVTIETPTLGALVNRVNRADEAPPWTFGAGALMRNLAERGLL
jgi:fumarylacetoacetate (FAA) hydrolase family protein